MYLNSPTMLRESTGQTWSSRHRTRSCGRLSCGISCQPCSTHRTAGSRGDRGLRWWRAGDIVLLLPWLIAFPRERDSSNGMPPKKLRRRSSNGRRRRVTTREGSKWKHAICWQSHDQRETMRSGTHWQPSSLRRLRPRIRGGGRGSAGECHQGGIWKCFPMAPG